MTDEVQPYDPPIHTFAGTRARRPSLTAVALLVPAFILLAGVAVAGFRGAERFAVPVKALPAYHLIEAGDVRNVSLRRGAGGLIQQSKDLVGRITRRALASGEPVVKSAVTKRVENPERYSGPQLRLAPTRSSNAGLEPGDAVRLRFAPVAHATVEPQSVDALLLDTTETAGNRIEFVVALNGPRDAARVLALVGRADLLVTSQAD